MDANSYCQLYSTVRVPLGQYLQPSGAPSGPESSASPYWSMPKFVQPAARADRTQRG